MAESAGDTSGALRGAVLTAFGGVLGDEAAADGDRGVGRQPEAGGQRSAGPGLLTRLGTAVDGFFLGRFAHDPAAFAAVLEAADQAAGSQHE